MSSIHDSERPGPHKRRVLRKIDAKAGAAALAPVAVARPRVEEPYPLTRTRAAIAPPAPVAAAPEALHPCAHNSAPPVVSTVATPPPTFHDSLPDAPSGSSWRGVVVGTVLGLAIVGAFVAGARLAHRSAAASSGSPVAAIAPPPTAVAVPPTQVSPASPPPGPPAVEVPGIPSIAATLLPTVKPPRGMRAAKPVAVKVVATPPAASAPVQVAAVEPPDPAPEDSAPSLVPVIPPAPKPTVDPFVRAVQQDIQEEQSKDR